MSLSTPFIERPVATTLLTIGVALAGMFAFFKLPVSPLPQVDFPTVSVFAQMPGASPETMATTVATPLERHLGVIADVTEITSSSQVGSTRITLQFGLSRSIDGAARDVQAAINAARVDLPSSLRTNPTYRKVNPADAPVLILSLTSDTETRGQMFDAASTILQPALSQIEGIGQVTIGGAAAPAVRVELNPTSGMCTVEPGTSAPATSQKLAALRSPGTSMSIGLSLVALCTSVRSPSDVMSAPIVRSISSVWSRVRTGSITAVVPSANRPASSSADFTCALGTGIRYSMP